MVMYDHGLLHRGPLQGDSFYGTGTNALGIRPEQMTPEVRP